MNVLFKLWLELNAAILSIIILPYSAQKFKLDQYLLPTAT